MRFKRGCGCGDGGFGSSVRSRSWRLHKTKPFAFSRPSLGASMSGEEHIPLSYSRPKVSGLVEDPFLLLCLRHNRDKQSIHEGPAISLGEELDEQINLYDPSLADNERQLNLHSLNEELDASMLSKYLQLELEGQEDSNCLESAWVTERTKGASQVASKQRFGRGDERRTMHQSCSRSSDEREAGHGEDANDDEEEPQYVLLSSASSGYSAGYPEDVYFSSYRVHDSLSGMDALSELDQDSHPFDSLCSRTKQPIRSLSESGENPDESRLLLSDSSNRIPEQCDDDCSTSSIDNHGPSSIEDGFKAIIQNPTVNYTQERAGIVDRRGSNRIPEQCDAECSTSSIDNHGPSSIKDGLKAIIQNPAINYKCAQERAGIEDRRGFIPISHPSASKGMDEVKDAIVEQVNKLEQDDDDVSEELNAILDGEDDFRFSKDSAETPDISMFFQAGESERSPDSSIYHEFTEFLEELIFQEGRGNDLDDLVKQLQQYEEKRQMNDSPCTLKDRTLDRNQCDKQAGDEDDLLAKAKEKFSSLMAAIRGPLEQHMEVPIINKDMWLSTIEKSLDSLLFPEFQYSTHHARPIKDSRQPETVRENRQSESLPLMSRKSKLLYCYEQVNGVPLGMVETVDSLVYDEIVASSSTSSGFSPSSSSFVSQYTGESNGESDVGECGNASSTDTCNEVVGPEDEIKQDITTNIVRLFSWRYRDEDDDEEPLTEDASTDYTASEDEVTTANDQQSLSTHDLSVSSYKYQAELSGSRGQQVSAQQLEEPAQTKAGSQAQKGEHKGQKRRFALRRLPSPFRHLLKHGNSAALEEEA
jgi:hypothetical protein